MTLKKYENEKVFTLRINADIFEKIKNIAEQNKRSISKQIEYVLEQEVKKTLD